MLTFVRRSRREVGEQKEHIREEKTVKLTVRECFMLDEIKARQMSAGIPYLGKTAVRREIDFVIAADVASRPVLRCPCRSELKVSFTHAVQKALTQVADFLSNDKIRHSIVHDPQRPDQLLHRIILTP